VTTDGVLKKSSQLDDLPRLRCVVNVI